MRSTARYASHSKLTREKPKDRISTKNKTLDLKIQKQIGPTCIVLINSRKREWAHECKCCQQKDRKEISQKGFEWIKK